jgi:hypothetical protein
MKPQYLLGILIILALIAPVSAEYVVTGNYAGSGGAGYPVTAQGSQVFSYSSLPDEAIGVVEYDIPINTRVDFTLTYGTGSTVSGYMIYEQDGPVGTSKSTVSIGSMTRSETFYDAQALGYALTKHVQFSSYGVNMSATPPETGFTLYERGFGLWSQEIVFHPVPDIANNMISSISITSTKGIDIAVEKSKRDILGTTLQQTASQSIAQKVGAISSDVQKLINFATQMIDFVLNLSITLLYWLKFFLWDNLVMTICLYIAITGAMAFGSTKDVFKAIKKFFGYQRALFEFILSMWQRLIDIIDRFRNIFRL